jgi:RimJ/RimL family protein N-acetyltransferase
MNLRVNDHLHLTDLRPADKAALVAYLNEKDIYDRTLRIPHPYTEADADTFLALVAEAKQQPGRLLAWAIRDDTDGLIGGCGLEEAAAGQSHRAELGYWLAKPYWGRGLMTAVVRRLCAYALDELGLVRLHAHVFAGNAASARVLEKCGFEREGYMRKYCLKDGRHIDAWLYARVR